MIVAFHLKESMGYTVKIRNALYLDNTQILNLMEQLELLIDGIIFSKDSGKMVYSMDSAEVYGHKALFIKDISKMEKNMETVYQCFKMEINI